MGSTSKSLGGLRAMRDRVKGHLVRENGYSLLLKLIVFVILFSFVTILQRNASSVFLVEDAIRQVVLTEGTNTRNGDGTPSETIPGKTDIYNWFSSIILKSHVNSLCGDGTCDGGELPFYARWGCRTDCGDYSVAPFQTGTLVTQIRVSFFLKLYSNGISLFYFVSMYNSSLQVRPGTTLLRGIFVRKTNWVRHACLQLPPDFHIFDFIMQRICGASIRTRKFCMTVPTSMQGGDPSPR
jgi:hypothetical protein